MERALESSIIKLYSQILEYEARAICQFNRNVAFQFARNLVKADSWKDILSSIHDSESACDKILKVLDAQDGRERFGRLERCLKQQHSRIDELLQASRAQDEEYQKQHLAELQTSRAEEKAWRHEQKSWHMSEEQSRCFEVLRTTPYEHNKERNKDPVEGTCKWFLEHAKYQEWLKKQRFSWLWVTADPGCGKSVLSKLLVNIYGTTKSTDGQNICYYFFKDDSEENKSATHALCALLHQLFTQNTELIKYAIPSYLKNGGKLPQLLETLWDIFIRATADPNAGNTVCVLDALDECAEDSRLFLIAKLSDFYSKADTNTGLKFLITSRPNATIQNEISRRSKLDLESIQLMGENDAEVEAISTEITLVIKARVEEFRMIRSRRGIDDNAHSIILKRLLNTNNRTYLWVALIFPELEENVGLHERKLLKLIETIPRTVDEAYEKILAQSSNIMLARKLLHIVVAAVRPLTVKEINIALAIQDTHKCLDDCDLEPEPSFRYTVRKICGLFVNIQDSKVYLIHQTAKEFLIFGDSVDQVAGNIHANPDKWKHSLRPCDSNLVLAKSCMTYILFTTFESNPLWSPRSPASWYDDRISRQKIGQYTDKHDFLDYAAKCWFIHLQQAKSKEDSVVINSALQLCNVLSNRCQTWFAIFRRKYTRTGTTDLMIGCATGLESIVKLLLERKDIDINAKDEHSCTALWYAIHAKQTKITKLLLKRKDLDTNSKIKYGLTPLLQAVDGGDRENFVLLLEHEGTDPNLTHDYGDTPLHMAIRRRNEEMVALLLKHKNIDPNSQDHTHSPLMLAVSISGDSGNKEIIKLLLAHKNIDLGLKNKNGYTALSLAAYYRELEVVKSLQQHPLFCRNVSTITHAQRTASESYEGFTKAVQLLEDKKAEMANTQAPICLDQDASVNLGASRQQFRSNNFSRFSRDSPLHWALEYWR